MKEIRTYNTAFIWCGGLSRCDGAIVNNVIAHNFSLGTGGGLAICKASIINNTIVNKITVSPQGLLLFVFLPLKGKQIKQ